MNKHKNRWIRETTKTIFVYNAHYPSQHDTDAEEELIRGLQHLGLFDTISTDMKR